MEGPTAYAGQPVQEPSALLEAVGVTKRFGAVAVLRDISLRIGQGEVVALVGENGAGKSVLIACLGRILDIDSGELHLGGSPMPSTANQIREAGVEVVWQDHGLCDDLDVVANLHLGREPGRFLAENAMREGAIDVLRQVGADALPLDRPVRTLSRGQRQLVAVGRALLARPRLLLLDEPTASLGIAETLRIQALIRRCRLAGIGLLLVTHDLEQVFALADRVVVLRQGRVVADTSPQSVNRDDIMALISGVGMDSTARRQLHRLRSLVDQLSDVEPAASLPLIVSAMATALDQDMLCVHLLEETDDGTAVLRRTAAVGLPPQLLEVNGRLPMGLNGGGAGLAAAEADVVVIDDLLAFPQPGHYGRAAAASGIRSEWAAPIVGARGVLGTVSGFATSVGRPEPAQLELARLYIGYAASAIEAAALRRSQAIQRDLLSSLSHELRTPLTAIQGYASTLRQPDLAWDAASTERFLDSIAAEAARLERLVGDLLDSSAIESGVLRLQRDWCDLQLVVEAAIGLVADGSDGGDRGAGPGIRLRLADPVEPVWGDHDRLEQVFVNMLENAATHGASQGGIEVTLRQGSASGTVAVEIRDHGPGLPLALGESIFEARVRGETDVAGAGLGLSIARAIVEAHGGTLTANPVDSGASFLVSLPMEPPVTADEKPWNLLDETRQRSTPAGAPHAV